MEMNKIKALGEVAQYAVGIAGYSKEGIMSFNITDLEETFKTVLEGRTMNIEEVTKLIDTINTYDEVLDVEYDHIKGKLNITFDIDQLSKPVPGKVEKLECVSYMRHGKEVDRKINIINSIYIDELSDYDFLAAMYSIDKGKSLRRIINLYEEMDAVEHQGEGLEGLEKDMGKAEDYGQWFVNKIIGKVS